MAGVDLTEEDVDIRRVEKDGYAAGTIEFGNDEDKTDISLVLDMEVNPELLSKGLARDITRRVQAKRKELDLDLEATIKLTVWLDEGSPELMESDWKYVQNETRAPNADLNTGKGDENSDVFDVDGISIGFKIE